MMIMIMKMMMMIMPAPAGRVGWEELEIVCVGSFPHCQDVQVFLTDPRHLFDWIEIIVNVIIIIIIIIL